MIDKGFLKTMKEFDRMRRKMKNAKPIKYNKESDIWEQFQTYGVNEKDFLQAYSNYKLFKWTKWLVIATWALAIGTLLVLILK